MKYLFFLVILLPLSIAHSLGIENVFIAPKVGRLVFGHPTVNRANFVQTYRGVITPFIGELAVGYSFKRKPIDIYFIPQIWAASIEKSSAWPEQTYRVFSLMVGSGMHSKLFLSKLNMYGLLGYSRTEYFADLEREFSSANYLTLDGLSGGLGVDIILPFIPYCSASLSFRGDYAFTSTTVLDTPLVENRYSLTLSKMKAYLLLGLIFGSAVNK